MAIEKNSFKVARFNRGKDACMSSEDGELHHRNYVESDGEDDGYEDCDSGAGSDDFDLLELGEAGEEFCQVGDQTCEIPYELYDLSGLKDVLSMEVWNEVLTEEERFGLSKYLPDMDQENFVRTMKEIFVGDNLHFGNPVSKLFDMLKGGLCEPRVALYRQGLNFFKMNKYYHRLRKHQNSMVSNVCQIRDAWRNYKGYSIEEKLQVLNIMRSQKSLMNENMEEFKGDSSVSELESGDVLWGKRVKDPNLGQKMDRYSGYSESVKHGKQNPWGALKLAGPKSTSYKRRADPFISPSHEVEMKSGRYGFGVPSFRHDNHMGHDSPVAVRMNEDDDEVETMYEVAVHRDQNFPVINDNRGAMKYWKKHEGARTREGIDSFVGMPSSGRNDVRSVSRNKGLNQLSDIKIFTTKPSHPRNTYDGGENVNLQQYTSENLMRRGKVQKTSLPLKGSQTELLDEIDPAWPGKQHGGLFPADLSYKLSESNDKTMKWMTGRDVADPNASNKVLHADFGSNTSKSRLRVTTLQNERNERVGGRGIRMFPRHEDTESDSSEQEDDDDENPLMRSKWAYPGGVPDLRYGPNMKTTNLSKRDKKNSYVNLDTPGRSSRNMEEYGHNIEMLKTERKGKMHDVGYVNILPSEHLEAAVFPFTANSIGYDNPYKFNPLGRNGHSEGYRGENFHMPSMRPPFIPERRLEGDVRREFGVPQPNNMQDSNFDDESFWSRPLASEYGMPLKLGKKGQMVEVPSSYQSARSDASLMGCNTISKKRKVKDDFTYLGNNNNCLNANVHLHDEIGCSRKRGKNKVAGGPNFQENGISESVTMEVNTEIVEPESKPQKKQFPLITPTVHTGFSFSIIHLLSAVRVAMITFLPDDSFVGKDQDKSEGKDQDKSDSGEGAKEEQEKKQEDKPNMDVDSSTPSNVPSLTIQEIVNRVKSNPGDPSILETQEPLQDLIRGVLKIFFSRTAPLGAKGWKALVVYEKSSKSWSWIGPVSQNLSDPDEEVTSPDAWGLPHKMLVKLVDTYASWLKNSQDTLQQIGTLPTPPLELMQINIDEKERFKDLKAQKSLSTISQSSEEVRAYFRKEELLRYLIPDRAFCYIAIDGKKSIVAPLRRCGGKPTSKARDHFMLKRDRPPHVTILCLVRDAASRLPGSIGTRADVCTLIRDSQYIVEDVSDAQVNQVVSGALDRLHYERDPCVQFDGERKLWVYLHRDREEEDFEDDGTSSTKKWRRPKKETTETPEQGDVTVVADSGNVEPSNFDLVSDLNVESFVEDGKRSEPVYHNGNDQIEGNPKTCHGNDPVISSGIELNPVEEKEMICQENSTHEDFCEDALDGDPPP